MSRKAKRETTDWYSALTEYLFFFKKHKPRDVVLYIGCLGVELQGKYRGMSSRYAAKAAYRCENPSAAAGALARN